MIGGVAFQAYIRALNAAVEAARAGAQVRRFAFMTGEVRSLEQRSGVAAREMNGLIDDSVHRIDAGARRAEEVGGRIKDIEDSIGQVTERIAAINAAAGNHTSSLAAINATAPELSRVMQENTDVAQSTEAATVELREQARTQV